MCECRFTHVTYVLLWCRILILKNMQWGAVIHGKFLYFSLNFPVNLELL